MTIETKAREWAEDMEIEVNVLAIMKDDFIRATKTVAFESYIAGAAEAVRWVPVLEKLPEKNGYYICWLDDPSEHGLIHYHTSAGWQNGFYNERVTHWFYLIPPHPEKEQL